MVYCCMEDNKFTISADLMDRLTELLEQINDASGKEGVRHVKTLLPTYRMLYERFNKEAGINENWYHSYVGAEAALNRNDLSETRAYLCSNLNALIENSIAVE